MAAGHSNHTATIQTMQETSHTLRVNPPGYEINFNLLRNSFDVTSSDALTLRQLLSAADQAQIWKSK
ncbi:uncharacterized protein PGTG_22651, partial [Puccinia graminis f. sp. tritici CRL 75-36-700-3]